VVASVRGKSSEDADDPASILRPPESVKVRAESVTCVHRPRRPLRSGCWPLRGEVGEGPDWPSTTLVFRS